MPLQPNPVTGQLDIAGITGPAGPQGDPGTGTVNEVNAGPGIRPRPIRSSTRAKSPSTSTR
jgi:hypothetical protein